jgi:hypothetical protein
MELDGGEGAQLLLRPALTPAAEELRKFVIPTEEPAAFAGLKWRNLSFLLFW